jgi:hypothetical protein
MAKCISQSETARILGHTKISHDLRKKLKRAGIEPELELPHKHGNRVYYKIRDIEEFKKTYRPPPNGVGQSPMQSPAVRNAALPILTENNELLKAMAKELGMDPDAILNNREDDS